MHLLSPTWQPPRHQHPQCIPMRQHRAEYVQTTNTVQATSSHMLRGSSFQPAWIEQPCWLAARCVGFAASAILAHDAVWSACRIQDTAAWEGSPLCNRTVHNAGKRPVFFCRGTARSTCLQRCWRCTLSTFGQRRRYTQSAGPCAESCVPAGPRTSGRSGTQRPTRAQRMFPR